MAECVIVDTSAFLALLSSSDNHHAEARICYERLIDNERELYTTSYILVEMAALIHRRFGSETFKTFMESIDEIIDVIWIDRATHHEAWKAMSHRTEKDLSLVDWITWVVALRLGAKVLCFDKDLVRIDLPVLP